MELLKLLVPALVGITTMILPAWWLHRREIRKYNKNTTGLTKAKSLLDNLLNLKLIYLIRKISEKLFEETKADRFLIIIGFNGTTDFKIVSAIYEEHKEHEYSAVKKYSRMKVDNTYREMLREMEQKGYVLIDYKTMSKGILKRLYHLEGVKHSYVKFLMRKKMDHQNDLIIYSSIATHDEKPYTDDELTEFQIYCDGIIVPNLNRYLEGME